MITDAKTPIFDARRYKLHARQIIGPDGRPRTEKRPIVKSALMVDPCGHVCFVPLYGGPSQADSDDQYMMSTLRSKTKKGWVDHDTCPKNSGQNVSRHLPDSVQGGSPCIEGAKPGPVGRTNPCKCVLALIDHRRGENDRRMHAVEGVAKTSEQVSHQLQAANLEETRALNKRLVEMAFKPADKSSAEKGTKA